MPRNARYAPGGMVYHVLNRGVGKQKLFHRDEDYLAFERVILETLEKRQMRILSYCLMPNHKRHTDKANAKTLGAKRTRKL